MFRDLTHQMELSIWTISADQTQNAFDFYWLVLLSHEKPATTGDFKVPNAYHIPVLSAASESSKASSRFHMNTNRSHK